MDRTLSVIMVNYNGGQLVLDSVRAALASSVPVELIFLDNGSSDGSLEQMRRQFQGIAGFQVIDNNGNLGFARAVNTGLRAAKGNYLLILNPDCLLQPDSLERLAETLDAHPDAGMAGCLVVDPDGTEQVGTRRAIPDPWSGLVRFAHLNRLLPARMRQPSVDLTHEPLPGGPVAVEAVSGACMLVRRTACEDVGGLDEGYFLHCEDIDWFVRFRNKGWEILFVPSVRVVHHKGACSRRRPLRVLWHKHRGMARFYNKFQAPRYPLPFNWLVTLGIWLRFALVATGIMIKR